MKTYKDIQKLTGLSLSTISKYFNGGALREENRRAIEQAAEKLDYRVNEFARGLKSRRSHTVGVLIPELNSAFNTAVMAEVGRALRARGYGTIVCDCLNDEAMEGEALRFLLNKMVDGVITIPLGARGEHLQLAAARGVPVVLVDRLQTGFKADAVVIDNERAGALAAEALLGGGHRRACMIAGDESAYTMRGRMAGFGRALLRGGAPAGEDAFRIAPLTAEGGYEAARTLLWGTGAPSALCCANYELTLGALMAVNELGLRIPDDVSLVGFDDLALARVVKPRLTIVAQPMGDIAREAARLMLERLEGGARPGVSKVELEPKLIAGESVLSLPTH